MKENIPGPLPPQIPGPLAPGDGSTNPPSSHLRLSRALASLEHSNFRIFMVSMLCFTAAMQMQAVTQGWLVFYITGSNLVLGMVTSMWSITMILFSPLAGPLADRLSKKPVLMLTWAGAGVSFIVIALLIHTEQIRVWHLSVAALVNGALFAFNIPARFALISKLVDDSRLVSGMALISVVFNFSGVVFPLVGGALIDFIGPAGAYLFLSVLYLLAAAVMGLLPLSETEARERTTTVLGDLVVGIQFVRKSRTLAWLLFLALVAVVLGQPYVVLLPDFAADTLGVPASGLGLLFTMMGLGALVGNFVVAGLGAKARLGRWMFLLGIASGLALIGLALTQSLHLALVALFLLGLTGPPFFTVNQTLVQLLSAPELRGRIQSLYMLTFAGMPLGVMPLAALADRMGVRIPFIVSGVTLLAVMILVAWFRRSLFDLTAQPQQASPLGMGKSAKR